MKFNISETKIYPEKLETICDCLDDNANHVIVMSSKTIRAISSWYGYPPPKDPSYTTFAGIKVTADDSLPFGEVEIR